MKHYEENLDLPQIPYDFLLLADEIELLTCATPELWKHGYGSFIPENSELEEFLAPYFDSDITVRYQMILNDLPAHTDICEQSWKYNFLYDNGGTNVTTEWWQDGEVTDTLRANVHEWCRFNVKIEHSVTGILYPRLSITVKLS